MLVSAGLVASGEVLSLVLLSSDDLGAETTDVEPLSSRDGEYPRRPYRNPCPVDDQLTSVGADR